MNDIVINKIQSIQRCVKRAREEYAANPAGFDTDYTRQDAAVLNVLRACELAIDLANHIIKSEKLGIPNTSVDSFELLRKKFVLDDALMGKMKNMVHFRNLIVHQYTTLDMEIVKKVIQEDLQDLVLFTDWIVEYSGSRSS
ncbi:MAG: DUF86 domain-containing protein [Candidatus Omnitrophota bacterium]|jgi:uncharacterized protein YutE (UPF0331/DUF86 family)|nr:MAG: DUF86 domain-containing protein [Candidatus Omnitrophota bacterium]